MQVALFIILLVTLTNSAPALNYSLFTTFQNPKDLTSITIAPDYSRAILYEVGQSENILIDAYSWQPTEDYFDHYHFGRCHIITFYTTSDHKIAVLYRNYNDQLRVRNYSPKYSDYLLYTFKNQESIGGKLKVSDDGSTWASYYNQGYNIYIGSTTVPEEVSIVSIEGAYPIDILWQPATLKLLINLRYNNSEGRQILYDVQTKQKTELNLSSKYIQSMSFGENCQLYYLDKVSIQEEVPLNSYDIDKNSTIQFPTNVYPREVKVRGQFIALQSMQGYVCFFWINSTSFNQQNCLFRLQDWYYFQAEAPDMGILVNRTYLPHDDPVQIYKLCNEPGYYYDKVNSQCSLCSTQCGTCFITSTSCITCNSTSYFPSLNRTCVLCDALLSNCLTCQKKDDQIINCLSCMEKYTLYGGNCRPCGEIIIGCRNCQDSKVCTECIAGYLLVDFYCQLCSTFMVGCQYCGSPDRCQQCYKGYILSQNEKCLSCSQEIQGCMECTDSKNCQKCQEGYLLINKSCTACSSLMEGCVKCTQTQTCEVCHEDYELNAETGKCEHQADDHLLIVIGSVAGVLVVAGVAIFLIYRRQSRKKRAQLIETNLESSQGGSRRQIEN